MWQFQQPSSNLSKLKNFVNVLGKIRNILSKIGAFGWGTTASIKYGQMRKASIKLVWKQKHFDKLETLGWSPSVKSNFSRSNLGKNFLHPQKYALPYILCGGICSVASPLFADLHQHHNVALGLLYKPSFGPPSNLSLRPIF